MQKQITRLAALMAVCLLASISALGQGDQSGQNVQTGQAAQSAQGGQETEVDGMIVSRTGETLMVNSPQGKVPVVLTDETVTKDDKGIFGLDKEKMSSVVLIPGLKLKVDGMSDGNGQVVAKTITVDGDDLETSQMVQSGLHPTAEQVAKNVATLESQKQEIASNKSSIETNQQSIQSHTQQINKNLKDIQENTDRFTALSDYDVKGEATLKFPVGSSTLSPQDQQKLKQLAQSATKQSGYIVEVMGYTDTTGSAKMNTKLSEDRAKAAITYLVQQGNVPVRRIVAPGAMGEYGAKGSNETKTGRAENRRVEVKVLVNKGIAGSS